MYKSASTGPQATFRIFTQPVGFGTRHSQESFQVASTESMKPSVMWITLGRNYSTDVTENSSLRASKMFCRASRLWYDGAYQWPRTSSFIPIPDRSVRSLGPSCLSSAYTWRTCFAQVWRCLREYLFLLNSLFSLTLHTLRGICQGNSGHFPLWLGLKLSLNVRNWNNVGLRVYPLFVILLVNSQYASLAPALVGP